MELKLAMVRKALTQEQLARAAGLTPKTVSAIFTHKHKPRGATVARIREALGLGQEEA